MQAHPEHRDYWNVVSDHGFTPHLWRSALGGRDWYRLMLRNPETDSPPITSIDHLPAAFGYIEPGELRNLRPILRQAYVDENPDTIKAAWKLISGENQAAVDRQGASYGTGARDLAAVGMWLAEMLLRVEIVGHEYALDPERYEEDVRDVRDNLRQLAGEKYEHLPELPATFDDIDTELWREINRIRTLRG